MMNNKIFLGSAVILVLLFSLFIRVPVIQLHSGNQICFLRVDEFSLSWVHSVEKEEWKEFYQREKSGLLLTETHFKTYGAGVPYMAEDAWTEDGLVKMEINRLLEEVDIAVSENVKTTIITETREIPLYTLVEDYENINISIAHISLWSFLGGNFI